MRRTWTLVAAAAALAAAAGGAVAARSEQAAPPASSASPGRVVLPGRPGEPARVSDADRVQAPAGSAFNTVDVTFVQMMIVHHGQAVEMARLAADRAADAQLRALAGRIAAAQPLEVAWLRSWLRQRGQPENPPGPGESGEPGSGQPGSGQPGSGQPASGHDHGSMPGMQTPAAMAELAGLRGAAFDRRFVAMMTAHHRGAQQMAGDVIRGGGDERLREVANEMAVEQGSEIRRMQQV